ncbi:MAG TPA: hypothetical protein VGZ00_09430 [Candidatus Baltobacteraceae bacterium]|nr:hypothetical protein [Candidatus Baltobacteraceae bacterium]
MKLVFPLLAIFAARFFVTAIAFPPLDGDLGWQRWLGESIMRTGKLPDALGAESFAAVGSPWVPQEWLFGVGAWVGRSGLGWDFFAGGIALCGVAALWFVAVRCLRREAGPLATAICTGLAGMALFESFGVRVQVAAWPFFALFLLLMDSEGLILWWSVPLVALWSNVHGSVMLAPVLASAYAVGSWIDARAWTPIVRRRFFVAGALLAATAANPLGVRLPLYALSLFTNPIRVYISEWRRTDIAEPSFLFGSFILILIILTLWGWTARRRWCEALPAAAMVAAALMAARNEAICGIALAPLAAPMLSRVLERFTTAFSPSASRKTRPFDSIMLLVGVVMGALVAFALIRSPERTKEIHMPIVEIVAAAALPGEHRLFCADFAWCSLALDRPNLRVFLDGRADPYPIAIWKALGELHWLMPGWRADLDRYTFDEIIVEKDSPLDQALARLPDWRKVTSDGRFRLWRRAKTVRIGPDEN